MHSYDSAWRAAEIRAVLLDELEKIRKEEGAESLTEVTKDMHMYPDLHGTRRTHTRRCIASLTNILRRKPLAHRRPAHARIPRRPHARKHTHPFRTRRFHPPLTLPAACAAGRRVERPRTQI